MEKTTQSWTLSEVAALVGGQAVGDDIEIRRPVPSDSNDPQGITFAENDTYLEQAETSNVGAVLICKGSSSKKPHIVVESPRLAFGHLLALMVRPLPYSPGIHPSAVVADGARVDPAAAIGPFAVIERGASVGARARVYAHAYVGDGCTVGADAVIFPHAVLVQDVHVGARSVIHSGVVLGADGFGFGWDGKTRVKVPQVGGVVIGDDVEIGANSTVDRATAGETVIGSGTKLDNLVQVAHNVRIGEHGVIASQTGISGSTTIGDRIVMGGNVGVSDHVTIGDDVALGARSGVAHDIDKSGEYFGAPALPKREGIRVMLALTKLPELISKVRALEKRLEEFLSKQ